MLKNDKNIIVFGGVLLALAVWKYFEMKSKPATGNVNLPIIKTPDFVSNNSGYL